MRVSPSQGQSVSAADASAFDEHSLEERAYRNAIDNNVPAPWYIFHRSGDILFTAEDTPESIAVRSVQAALRTRECLTRGCSPRFSHVLMCVTPGLFIESSPASWWRDLNKPAVKFLRAEELPRSRSNFLVIRHSGLCANTEFAAKILLRSIFHGGKPYHFYLVGDNEDRVFCSELIATWLRKGWSPNPCI